MLRVRTVGECRISTEQGEITPASEVFFALTLVLSAERGRRVQRDWLLELIWPGESAQLARHNLRQMVYRLGRQNLVPLQIDKSSILLPAESVHLDFEDPTDADDDLLAASSGLQILPGYQPPGGDELRDWVERLRMRAEGGARRRLSQAIDRARAECDWVAMEMLSRNLLQLDPLSESATVAMAESLAINGSKFRALEILKSYENEVGSTAEGQALVRTPALLRRRIARALPEITPRPGTEQLIGRDGIVRMLRDRLAAAKQHVGGLELIVGDRGAGKTRLLTELQMIAALDGYQIVHFAVPRSADEVPGTALTAIVRRLLDADGSMGTDPAALQLLRTITGAAQEPNGSAAVGAETLLAATTDLLRALVWERALCILIDDLDLADALSISVLHRVSTTLERDRFLAIATSTSKLTSAIRISPAHLHPLPPLDGPKVLELATRSMLAAGFTPHDEWLHELAATSTGLPWDIIAACESSIRGANSGGKLSISAYLTERIASLDTRSRRVLVTASLLNAECTLEQLARTSQLPSDDIEAALLSLVREGIVAVGSNGQVTMNSRWRDAIDDCVDGHELALRQFAVAMSLEQPSSDGSSPSPMQQLRAADLYRASGDRYAADALVQSASSALYARGLGWTASVPITRALDLAADPASWKSSLLNAIGSSQDIQDVTALERLLHSTRLHYESLAPLLTSTERLILRVVQLEVDVMTLRDAETVLLECADLLTDPELQNEQRLRTILAAIKAADHINDYERVRLLGQLLPREEDPSCVRSHLRMQNAKMAIGLAHGDLATATHLAETTIIGLDDAAPRLDVGSALLNARIPFIYDCNYSRIRELLERASDLIVGKYSSTLLAIRILDAQATVAIECLDLERASHLNARCFELASTLGYASLETSLSETKTRMSVASGARPHLAPIAPRPTFATGRFERSRMYRCANALILAARIGAVDTVTSLLPESAMHIARLADGTPIDYPIVAYAVGLAATGQRDLAAHTLHSFATQQRLARHPPSPLCHRLLEEFAIPSPW